MTSSQPPKFIIYARKSEENDERQVQSIPNQIHELERFATQHGLSVLHTLTEEKSAKEPYTRPVFQEMLSLIQAGGASGILVWNINRLARNPVDGGTLQWLLMNGVIEEIRTPERSYRPEDNTLLLSVETSMATQFVRDLAKGVKRGLHSKADRGWFPGIAPLGYLNTKTQERGKNTIVPDPERFDLVRHAWDLMLTGTYLPRDVLKRLTDDGFRSPKRNKIGGGPLSLSAIYKVFHNPFYMGFFTYTGKVYKGNHLPMVTPEEFDRVQQLLGGGAKPKKNRHSYTYAGIFTCATCSGQITPTTILKKQPSKPHPKPYIYYYCHRARRTKGSECTQSGYLNEMILDGQLLRDFEQLSINEHMASWGIQTLQAHFVDEGNIENQKRMVQEKALKDMEKELQTLNHMRLKDMITDNEHRMERKRIDLEILKLERQLSLAPKPPRDTAQAVERALRLASHLTKLFLEAGERTRRLILMALYSNRTISGKRLALQTRLWIRRLGENARDLEQTIEAFEPQKYGSVEVPTAPPATLIPQLCGLINNLRDALEADDLDLHNLPDLSQEVALHPDQQRGDSPDCLGSVGEDV